MADTRKTPPLRRTPDPGAGPEQTRDGNASGSAAATRLRDGIDRGGAGDKVGFSDPAAAPLGTDDEAAGFGPTPAQVAEARRHEIRAPAAPAKETPADLQRPALGRFRLVALVGVLLIAMLLVAWASL